MCHKHYTVFKKPKQLRVPKSAETTKTLYLMDSKKFCFQYVSYNFKELHAMLFTFLIKKRHDSLTGLIS